MGSLVCQWLSMIDLLGSCSSAATELELDLRILIVHSPGELKCFVEHLAVVKSWANTWRKSWVLHVFVFVCVCGFGLRFSACDSKYIQCNS